MRQTEEYLKLYQQLNINQKEAVNKTDGPVMLIAGPGTGKTQVLTLRIANIIFSKNIKPENILALTFTESGVIAMRKRLAFIVGTPAYRVNINTFHGFCNELLQDNTDYFPSLIGARTASELDRIIIIEEFIKSNNLQTIKPYGDPLYYVKPILAAISDLKKEGITVDDLQRAIADEEADFEKNENQYHEKGQYKGRMKGIYERQFKNICRNNELLRAYSSYQDGLVNKRLYDFEDMLFKTLQSLRENNDLLIQLQKRYEFILLDEHQDTNTVQNKIIELLCQANTTPNLFVVGDEKQAIYRFQGASLENFLYFKKLFPGAEILYLKDNYRSSQAILDASWSLVRKNKFIDKPLLDNIKLESKVKFLAEPQIRIIELSDYYGEYFSVGEMIREKIKEGVDGSEIVVLGRENKDLKPFSDVFSYLDIPFVIESDQNILKEISVQKLSSIFLTIAKFGLDEPLIRAMHIDCFNIEPLDIYKLVNIAKEKGITVWQLLGLGRNVWDRGGRDQLNEKSSENQDGLFENAGNIEKLYRLLCKWKKVSLNYQFDYFFKTVLEESGLLKQILEDNNGFKVLEKITVLYGEIRRMVDNNYKYNLNDFLIYLSLWDKYEVLVSPREIIVKKEAVRLMTAHRSKGLEFDYVFIINAVDGHWGNNRKHSRNFLLPFAYINPKLNNLVEDDMNEDERRLFYVAMTRARKEVIISYSNSSLNREQQLPSQFIDQIEQKYRQKIDQSEFEKNFYLNKHFLLYSQKNIHDNTKDFLTRKDYINQLFYLNGFSISNLNNYLKCPWRYFFRDLIKIPEVIDKKSIYGLAIHKAINKYICRLSMTNEEKYADNINVQGDLFGETRTIRNDERNSYNDGLNFLLNSFEKALTGQSLAKEENEEMLRKGKNSLTGYYATYMKDWDSSFLGEFPICGVRLSDKLTITGRLDMIQILLKSDDVVVYDFKSRKPLTRGDIEGSTRNSRGDYKRQLVFYKMLLEKYKNRPMHMVKGVIDFIEPNDRGEYKREIFSITKDEVKALEEQVLKIAGEIITLGFWRDRCEDRSCEYCRLREFMGK